MRRRRTIQAIQVEKEEDEVTARDDRDQKMRLLKD